MTLLRHSKPRSRNARLAAALLALASLFALASACGGAVSVEVNEPTPTPVVIERQVLVTPTPTAEPPAGPAPTPLPDTRTVSDDTGRQVEIPYRPKSVAVTNAWMVELLMSCGYTPSARPQIPFEFMYPPEAFDIPVVTISHSAGPNMEQLASVRPDLVLATPMYARFGPPIEQALGVPVLVYDLASADEVLDKMGELGEMVGCAEGAEQAAADLRARMDIQRQDLPAQGPKVLALFGSTEGLLAFTSVSYLGDMVELMGGELVADEGPPFIHQGRPDAAFTPFSLETVVDQDPDVVFLVRHANPTNLREEALEELFASPAWNGLRAVEEGRLHELSEWLYLRYPGPRVAWAMQELRAFMYPAEQR